MEYNDLIKYKQNLHRRLSAFKAERSSWVAHWKEISRFLLPRSGRFFSNDRNKGYKKHNDIIDSTATKSLRILGAGMLSGAMSPSRQWFRLTLDDKDLSEYLPIREYLNNIMMITNHHMQLSNIYRTAHSMFEELGAFGTSASIFLQHEKYGFHNHFLTIGEYYLDSDSDDYIDTLYREFDMTVRNVVAEFGYENCSSTTKRLYDNHQLDQWISIINCIEPRRDRDEKKLDTKNMSYANVYFELQSNNVEFLRISGFDEFPVIAPRWTKSSVDIYGSSPAMDALGDIKSLQKNQIMKAQCIDYQTNPPLQIPSSLRNRKINTQPFGITYVDNSQDSGIKTSFQVGLNLDHLLADIQDIRERIKASFYTDLFLMLTGVQGSRMTTVEVNERQEEKLLMLGPVVERLHNEMLNPFVTKSLIYLYRNNLLPPMPAELKDRNIEIQFTSSLAYAQKTANASSIDRFLTTVSNVSQFKPEVLDNIDEDRWTSVYSDMIGVDPRIFRKEDEVKQIREQRQQQQEQQIELEQQQQQSESLRNVAQAKNNTQEF